MSTNLPDGYTPGVMYLHEDGVIEDLCSPPPKLTNPNPTEFVCDKLTPVVSEPITEGTT